jgi:hypothetical protein
MRAANYAAIEWTHWLCPLFTESAPSCSQIVLEKHFDAFTPRWWLGPQGRGCLQARRIGADPRMSHGPSGRNCHVVIDLFNWGHGAFDWLMPNGSY